MKQKMQLKTKIKTKEYYVKDNKVEAIHVGDKVLVVDNTRKNKLSPIWIGPYMVTEIVGEYNIKIQKEKRVSTIHRNNVKLFHD
jgi:hypothetical protein